MADIRLIKPYLSFDEVEQEFRAVFESGMFTRGANVDAFRRELGEYTGAKHTYLATSATTALWSCLKLLNIGPGDEVVVSDFSFPASANVVEDLGARPVFADVSRDTFNMLPASLEARIGPRTKAVMFVDALGNPSGLSEIKSLCEHYGLPLIEDAACALGSSENDRQCGGIADLTCFSFHPRKLLNTGEGGAITTNNDEWAQWLDVKLSHGARGTKGAGLDFVDYGYNFRLPELQAVMGRKQLQKLDAIIDERLDIRKRYVELLEPMGFRAQQLGPKVRHNVQSLVFRVPQTWLRDALIAHLRACGIESTLGTYAMSAGTYYRSRYADVQPNAAMLEASTITLPCYSGVDVETVVDAIGRFQGEAMNDTVKASVLDLIRKIWDSEEFKLVDTDRTRRLREELLTRMLSLVMTDDERAALYGMPAGCRIRESAKIIAHEKLVCGEYVWIGEGAIADASGGLELGAHTTLGTGVFVWSHSSALSNLKMDNAAGNEHIFRKKTTIGRGCFIGGPSVVYPGVTIGDQSIVMPMSVVTQNVPPRTMVAGSPARLVREIDEAYIASFLKRQGERGEVAPEATP